MVLPGWLAACAAAVEDADVVAGNFDFWSLNGGIQATCRRRQFARLGFLPAGLGANLAVRREAFEKVCGFNEEPLPGEDIDLCWRLQLQGFRFATAPNAVVAKRERAENQAGVPPGLFLRPVRTGPLSPLQTGRRPSEHAWRRQGVVLVGLHAARASPHRASSRVGPAAGMRSGRLMGSVEERVFFP